MSAPDTNVSKQERKHRPSLFGIKGALIFVIILTVGFMVFNATQAPDPDAAAEEGATSVAPETDVYEPGTNSAATPASTD